MQKRNIPHATKHICQADMPWSPYEASSFKKWTFLTKKNATFCRILCTATKQYSSGEVMQIGYTITKDQINKKVGIDCVST